MFTTGWAAVKAICFAGLRNAYLPLSRTTLTQHFWATAPATLSSGIADLSARHRAAGSWKHR